MVKETHIPYPHIISEDISGLIISHTRPGFLALLGQVIDTKTIWLGFEEEIVHDYFVDSILISLLYFAILSVRESEPVLIYPVLRPTARSAIKVSSVSPER